MSGSLLKRALRLNPQLQPFDARPVKRVGDNRACPWPMGHGRSSHHQTKGLRPGRSGDDLGRNPDDLKLGPWDFQGGFNFRKQFWEPMVSFVMLRVLYFSLTGGSSLPLAGCMLCVQVSPNSTSYSSLPTSLSLPLLSLSPHYPITIRL